MGFEALKEKYKKRDQQLPEQRKRLMKAIEQDFINDSDVLALFYGGSIGKQNNDTYSDIDLRVVVKDEVFEEYRLNKKVRTKKWGTVLFFEDFPWTTYSVAHFDTFIKVDTFYYRKKDLQPSVWLQHKIIHDPEAIVETICKDSMLLSYKPTVQDVEIWRTKFFAYVHEIYRRVMRKEIFYAIQCLENLRYSIVSGWYMAAGIQVNNFGDWSKIEGERSQLEAWQLTLLETWHSSRNRDEIIVVMKSMIPEFKRLHRILCDVVSLEYNQDLEDRILSMAT